MDVSLEETRIALESKGFEFGVFSDPDGVYYIAIHEGDVVYADVRVAYSLEVLRDMYKECTKRT